MAERIYTSEVTRSQGRPRSKRLREAGSFAASGLTIGKSDIVSLLGISDWALQKNKPSYVLDEVLDGSERKLSDYLKKSVFEDLFEKVNIGTAESPTYAIRAKYGLYSEGFLSAFGLKPGGGGGEGVTSLYDLDEVNVNQSTLSNGQSLVYKDGEWVNELISQSVNWGDITGKPSWIGTTKPIYTWSEINGKPSWIGTEKPTYTTSDITEGSRLYYTDARVSAKVTQSYIKSTLGISDWALASVKPSYTLDEVTDGSTRKLSNYLPLAGGTMGGSAVIRRVGISKSWITGRDGALIRTTSYTGYNPILSMKTTSGSWDFGVYTDNKAYLTYCTDANYSAGTNSPTYYLLFPQKNGTLAVTTDNVESANKLATARTLWGQSFNGTANIAGVLSSANGLTPGADNTYNIGSASLHYKNVYATWIGTSSSVSRAISLGTVGANDLCINTSHNVGIGTTSPSQKLHVNGSILATAEIYAWSDMRRKDVVKPISISLKSIAEAPLFRFRWKNKNDNKIHIGTSAQYWNNVAGELVSGDEVLSLNYSVLGTAIGITLARKVQELENEINMLKHRNQH